MSAETINDTIRQQQTELASLIGKHCPDDGIRATALSKLFLIRMSQPTEPLHTLHEPALCIVAQGRKQVILAGELYFYGPNHCLVVSIDLPIVGHVIEATPALPYLCLRLDLDPGQLGALMIEAGLENPDGADSTDPISSTPASTPRSQTLKTQAPKTAAGLSISPVGPELLDATIRLLRLLDTPQDIPIMAPLITREILYRLLAGGHWSQLRQIALVNNQLQPINKAINWLKQNYAEPFHIETLAREAHMSSSALHHHFKTVTAMSPLQYQKQLRLQEARRLMLAQALDAATAGYRVGYESPSQFSREYSRLFGAPPLRDIARLRSSDSFLGG
jgi:AraC-like DNA-binding protein